MHRSIATRVFTCLLLWAGATCPCRAQTAAALYSFAVTPAWIAPAAVQYDAPLPASGTSGGSWQLMDDRQIDVNERGDDYYQHEAIRVYSSEGVDGESQINLQVDPSYQTLAIHSLQLVRNGKVIDQRKLARITALPIETEVEKHVFNGGYSVNLLLANVRIGDVVEYSYSVHSLDHLFPGHYARRFIVGWSVPILWQRLRLRCPASRALQYRFNGGDVAPLVQQRGAIRDTFFVWERLAGIPAQSQRPAWYAMWPSLEVSDYGDWSQVAGRMEALYRIDERPRPQLDALVATLRAAGVTREQQVMRALQFVQDEIRYTSIDIGRGSFAPTDPEVVLSRRFGDCKDKSLLLSAILRRLDIDATPALVHSRRGHALPRSLPSVYAFDHVIVRVRIGDAVYWLDGTEAKQYSALARLEPADFEFALVIAPQQHALQPIPRPRPDARSREVLATLDLRHGLLKPATFEVVTRYRNASADYMRASLSRTSDAQRQSDYVNYYARLYPGIRAAGAIAVTDDTDNDVLVTHEHYLIDKVASEPKDGRISLELHSDEIYHYGDPLDSSVRSAPLAIDYPANVKQTVTALLPEQWAVKDEDVGIDNAAFHYRSTVRHSDRTLTLSYEYRSLADHVDVDALPRYIADRKRLNDDMDYRYWRDANAAPAAAFALAPLPFMVAALSLLLACWLMIRVVYRYDPAARPTDATAPRGIAGWLLLPAFSAVVHPVTFSYLLWQFLRMVDARSWQQLPAIVAAPYRLWAQPVLLLLLGLGVAILCFTCTVAVLFFRRRSSLPALFIGMLCLVVAFSMLSIVIVSNAGISSDIANSTSTAEVIGGVVAIALWSLYMPLSRRVRATFVKRLADQSTAATPAQHLLANQVAD